MSGGHLHAKERNFLCMTAYLVYVCKVALCVAISLNSGCRDVLFFVMAMHGPCMSQFCTIRPAVVSPWLPG